MFSGGLFWSKFKHGRFESSELLRQPYNIVSKLRDKEHELKKAALLNGSESDDQKKYDVISCLMKDLESLIAEFNDEKIESTTDEIANTIKLVQKMSQIVDKTKHDHINILMISRNHTREDMKQTVYWGSFALSFLASTQLSLTTLGKAVFLIGLSPQISEQITKMTGLDDTTPESFRLVCYFSKLLHEMLISFNKVTRKISEDDSETIEEFICPINFTKMQDPVLCTLDGHTYEKEAIARWLYVHKDSPVTRAKMKNDQSVFDVLISNRNLKSLMEKYNSKLLPSNKLKEGPKL